MELLIRASGPPAGEQPLEIVERKGIGHPDTVCDGIAEHVSQALCRHYLERFGSILHHNVDKVLLVGGVARARFGGGDVIEPIEIYLAGRATEMAQGERIATADIAVEACRDWLRQHLPGLDLERHVRIIPRLRPGSSDLTALFQRRRAMPLANDTSCGAGFAPLSALERTVLSVERAINASTVEREHPEIGQDVKVMGVRCQDRIALTIGCALIARHIADMTSYEAAKAAVHAIAVTAARRESELEIAAVVNAADDLERGEVFLTVTGTSAESGDDGEVGRGNRANGLITPYRPMTLEAAAGKNPVTHVGKLYNLAAARIASRAASELPGVRDASCVLVSQIGRPIDDPQAIDIGLCVPRDAIDARMRGSAAEIARATLSGIESLRDDLLAGRIGVY